MWACGVVRACIRRCMVLAVIWTLKVIKGVYGAVRTEYGFII